MSRHPTSRVRATLGACALGALVLTGCSGPSHRDAAASDDGTIAVVTSTNVYSDLVAQVGGNAVNVTPVIDSAAQDPHSYEATPQDRLAVADADLVVLNGGGYDAFMETMARDKDHVVDAVEASGLQPEADEADHDHDNHSHGEFNEHVWYDLDSMQKLTTRVARELGGLDHEHAQDFTDRADSLNEQLAGLADDVTGIHADGGYVATEPLAGYLLRDAGLDDRTPPEFTEAVDAESDIPPAVLKETTDVVTGGVDLLVFNQQTATGQIERLRKAAQAAGVPVVEFTELLPDGENYQQWMRHNIAALSRALGK